MESPSGTLSEKDLIKKWLTTRHIAAWGQTYHVGMSEGSLENAAVWFEDQLREYYIFLDAQEDS